MLALMLATQANGSYKPTQVSWDYETELTPLSLQETELMPLRLQATSPP